MSTFNNFRSTTVQGLLKNENGEEEPAECILEGRLEVQGDATILGILSAQDTVVTIEDTATYSITSDAVNGTLFRVVTSAMEDDVEIDLPYDVADGTRYVFQNLGDGVFRLHSDGGTTPTTLRWFTGAFETGVAYASTLQYNYVFLQFNATDLFWDVIYDTLYLSQLYATIDSLADSAVLLTGDQTIAGIKTFSSAPVVPSNSFPQSAITALVADLAAKAADSAVVHKTGDETIAGIKTFSSAPVLPAASIPNSAMINTAINSGYVDATSSIQTQLTNALASDVSTVSSSTTLSTSYRKGSLYYFSGSSNITFTIPSGISNGKFFYIINNCTGTVTISTSPNFITYENSPGSEINGGSFVVPYLTKAVVYQRTSSFNIVIGSSAFQNFTKHSTVSADYTVANTDARGSTYNITTGGITITLPTTALKLGMNYFFQNTTSSSVTLDATSGNFMEHLSTFGAAWSLSRTFVIPAYAKVWVNLRTTVIWTVLINTGLFESTCTLANTQTVTGDKTFNGTTTFGGNIIANALTITPTELGYIDGLTSNAQTQISAKAADSAVVHLAGTETLTGDKTLNGVTTFGGNIIANSLTITPTELGYIDGLSSNAQTQINAKAADSAVVHLASTETITGDKTLSGTTTFSGSIVANSLTITPTELGYLDGATSNLQTQINALPVDGSVVHKATTETITGDKTFNGTTTIGGNIVANSLTITPTELGYIDGLSSNAQTQISAKAADSAVVHNSGAETIAGVKTFSSAPVLPSASIPNAAMINTAISSGYVDATSSIQTQIDNGKVGDVYSITADYTFPSTFRTDSTLILSGSSNITVTFPVASSASVGKHFNFVNDCTGVTTFDFGTDSIAYQSTPKTWTSGSSIVVPVLAKGIISHTSSTQWYQIFASYFTNFSGIGSISSNTTINLTANTGNVYLINTSGITLTLPNMGFGFMLWVVNQSGGTMTVAPLGGSGGTFTYESVIGTWVSGQTSITVANNARVCIVYTTSSWYVLYNSDICSAQATKLSYVDVGSGLTGLLALKADNSVLHSGNAVTVNSTNGYYNLGTLTCPNQNGSRVKIRILGGSQFTQNSTLGEEIVMVCSVNAYTSSGAININGRYYATGDAATFVNNFTWVQTTSLTYDLYANFFANGNASLFYESYNATFAPLCTFYGASLPGTTPQITLTQELKLLSALTVSGGVTMVGSVALNGTTTFGGNISANSLTITPTELGYIDGLSSNAQTQINTKATDSLVTHLAGSETITGAKTFSGGATFSNLSGNSSLFYGTNSFQNASYLELVSGATLTLNSGANVVGFGWQFLPCSYGRVNWSGSAYSIGGFNVSGVSRSSAGVVQVTVASPFSINTDFVCTATTSGGTDAAISCLRVSSTVMEFHMYNFAVYLDGNFTFEIKNI